MSVAVLARRPGAASRRGPSTAALARVLVTLKLRLLRNSLRRSPWQVVGLALAALYGLGITVSLVAGLVALRGASVEVAGAVVVLGGSAVILAWALVPLVAFGTDATLDPARLLPYPAPARALVPGLALAGVVGLPGLVTALVAAGTVVTWSRGPVVTVVAALAAALAVATAVSLSRLSTSAFARLFAGRRRREWLTVVALLVISLVAPALALLVSAGDGITVSLPTDPAVVADVAAVLAWSPLGWAWGAPAALAAGQPVTAAVRLVLAAALLVVVLDAWSRVLARSLTGAALTQGPRRGLDDDTSRHDSAGPDGRGASRRGLARRPRGASDDVRDGALLARLETTRTGAAMARSLRYWRRDARYVTTLVSLLGVPLIILVVGAAFPLPSGVVVLFLGPVLGFFLGWASHDDVAYDGTAVWMVVAAGLPGRCDRVGRSLAVLVWAGPLVVLACVLSTGISGRWELLPAVLGVALALLGAGQGVSAISSAATPYPVQEPDASPFASPPGSVVVSVAVQLVSSVVGLSVASPAIALAIAAYLLTAPGAPGLTSFGALVAGVLVGAGAWALGMGLGARTLDRRGPEVIAALQR